MDKWQSVHAFWNGFGLPAYDAHTVMSGENAPAFPYITYDVSVSGNITEPILMTASLWYHSTRWDAISAKASEIGFSIGPAGKLLQTADGYVWVMRSTPWAQRMDDPSDDMIRRIVLTVEAHYLTGD